MLEDFAIKDLGELSYFLGVEVFREGDHMVLSQKKYAIDLLHKIYLQKLQTNEHSYGSS